MKFVGKFLKAHAIIVDRRVKLVAAKKFLLKKHAALEGVVEEEPVQLCPHRLRVISVANDGVEDVLGDGLVQLAGDGGVDGQPVVVREHEVGVDGAINVIDEVVLTEDEGEVSILGIVG